MALIKRTTYEVQHKDGFDHWIPFWDGTTDDKRKALNIAKQARKKHCCRVRVMEITEKQIPIR
ncbi:MAG: hypothetical protein JSV32_06475 [Dehalococcoidia bacterium]|nr:MAG: hypothetical protein JSV32_06475 [Dehalococcoidia bacterium]